MNVTIKHMALQLGLSPSTVSRALKDDGSISERTKATVRALAKELNYEPNPFALMLRNQSSKNIAVLIPQVKHLYFSEILGAIHEEIERFGYQMLIYQSNDSYERELSIIRSLSKHQIEGLIAICSKETSDFSHFTKFMKQKPVIFVDRVDSSMEHTAIITDDFTGAYRATEHLILQGYKRIAYLGTQDELLINEVREQGYREALENYGISSGCAICKCQSPSIDDALQYALHLLDQPPHKRPEAIFANDDMIASGILVAAKELGISIPEDLGLVGFGDLSFSAWLNPPLTSVTQNGKKVGKYAGNSLLSYLTGKSKSMDSKIVDTQLIIRDSSNRNSSVLV